jgi:hypothetical protein
MASAVLWFSELRKWLRRALGQFASTAVAR